MLLLLHHKDAFISNALKTLGYEFLVSEWQESMDRWQSDPASQHEIHYSGSIKTTD